MAIATNLRALEECLLTTAVRRDAEQLEALLAEQFVEFGSSGTAYTRSEIVATLAAEAPRTTTMHDFALQVLTPGIALVTYRSRTTRADGSHAEALRSSLWVLRAAGWQMLFHQGTPAKPA